MGWSACPGPKSTLLRPCRQSKGTRWGGGGGERMVKLVRAWYESWMKSKRCSALGFNETCFTQTFFSVFVRFLFYGRRIIYGHK